jgi:hypothetical protein
MATLYITEFANIGRDQGHPAFHQKLIDSVYGGQMGNRPGTHDGSRFIGRGAPQVTGRDGYAQVGRRCGLATFSTLAAAGDGDEESDTGGKWNGRRLIERGCPENIKEASFQL